MNTSRLVRTLTLLLTFPTVLPADVPPLINYQGRVAVGTVNFSGSGKFRFALVNAAGTTTFWSNDLTSTAGSEPTDGVTLPVVNGLYSVPLGDNSLPSMKAIPLATFANTDVRLRVWFNDGVHGSQLLTPDQRITSVGYAMIAGSVPAGSITSGQLAPGAVQGSHIAAGAVGAAQLAPAAVGASMLNVPAAPAPGQVLGTNAFGALQWQTPAANWLLGGNGGTTGANFLGTTDNQPLVFKVNGVQALRLEPNATSPNLIGGYVGNTVTAGIAGATISGGGDTGNVNSVTANFGTVGGGAKNTASHAYSVVSGGASNTASGEISVVSGGESNTAGDLWSVVSGGRVNVAGGGSSVISGGESNIASGFTSVISGGANNVANGEYSVVPGGVRNEANGSYSFAAGRGAKALHLGAFVWADSTVADFASTAADQFNVRAGGGVRIFSGTGALRIEPTASTPNMIGGLVGNTVDVGIVGATIAGGGGDPGFINRVTANYGTVGGGYSNTASGLLSVVGGGLHNIASSRGSVVSGGESNISSGALSVVPGGFVNAAIGDYSFAAGRRAKALHLGAFVWADTTNADFESTAADQFNVRAGGGVRILSGTGALRLEPNATSPNLIGGYVGNTVDAGIVGATIAGGGASGFINRVTAVYGTVGGGETNTASGGYSVIGGGRNTTASGPYSVISGGVSNTAIGESSVIGGGNNNTASVIYSVISGGGTNVASGIGGVVPGGFFNAANGYTSFAAGYRAKALHDGAFVWADDTEADFASTADNQFNVRAAGGVRIFSNGAATLGVSLAANGTSWGVLSDQNAKKNFHAVDGRVVLEQLAAVPVQRWNYKAEPDDAVPHLGPMAQAFKAAFYPGRDDKIITTLEFDGVELAAIQGLNEKLKEKDAEIAEMKQRLTRLESLLLPAPVQTIALKKGN